MKRILNIQQEIGTLSKNAKNPFFKSQYLDLNDLLTHVTPLLTKEGLILMQPIIDNVVTTQIIDSKNGLVLASSGMKLPEIVDPQKIGSAITYFRRYTLKSLLAISEKDDDGNLASTPPPKPKATTKPPLDNKGMLWLRQNGEIKHLTQALNERELTPVQLETINELIKKRS